MKQVRVLCIEDEPAFCGWVDVLLSNEGYDVRVAMTGSLGEKLLSEWSPHVLILNHFLPDMIGFELLDRLGESGKQVSVIYQSAAVTDEMREEASRKGVVAVLEKPVRPEALLLAVKAAALAAQS